ncbi:hypothetical protein MSG28_001909 [Choristoneura fumiferana]|uniref:Uncharacterized protein n=1 Tax=Choristoneura fumiferana TaxID=7141 RepID=A0ACC0JTQ6_CHOFU|nr:hypothetical protein MSG28_001909 [Choristoneura fumiferana]
MESNIDCNLAEKDDCICKSGATLAILKDVQRAYEERMDVIERVGGKNKLQMQVCVLRSWVGDLVAQNSLLARAVEDLEQETTTRLALERRRHAEVGEAEILNITIIISAIGSPLLDMGSPVDLQLLRLERCTVIRPSRWWTSYAALADPRSLLENLSAPTNICAF